jgi:hypothetical protein
MVRAISVFPHTFGLFLSRQHVAGSATASVAAMDLGEARIARRTTVDVVIPSGKRGKVTMVNRTGRDSGEVYVTAEGESGWHPVADVSIPDDSWVVVQRHLL